MKGQGTKGTQETKTTRTKRTRAIAVANAAKREPESDQAKTGHESMLDCRRGSGDRSNYSARNTTSFRRSPTRNPRDTATSNRTIPRAWGRGWLHPRSYCNTGVHRSRPITVHRLPITDSLSAHGTRPHDFHHAPLTTLGAPEQTDHRPPITDHRSPAVPNRPLVI